MKLKLLLIFSFACPVWAEAILPSPPEIAAIAYILVDASSGKVLVERNADDQVPPASLTKIMTGYVLADEIRSGHVSRQDAVEVSANAWAQNPLFEGSSLMWIEPGLEVSVSELEHGIVVSSGNDASVALAEFLSGSEEIFSEKMNRYAKLLSLDSTYYVNSHGLPDKDHLTTARDLANLSRALIRNFPEHYSIYKKRDFTYNNIRQYNRNTLLVDDPSVDGLKTGYTKEAGYCLVASAEREGMRLISVVLGTSSPGARKRGTRKLLNYGFRFFETVSRFSENNELAVTRVWQGDRETLSTGVSTPVFLTVPRGASEDIEMRVILEREILAPIAVGDTVGRVTLTLGDEVLHEAPLTARENILRSDFFSRLWDVILMWLNSVFLPSETSR